MKQAVRFILVFLGVTLLLQGLSHGVELNREWPLWAVALAVAATVELILWLYQYEARAVPKLLGRWMIGLRLAAFALLVWILMEPVWVRKAERELRREVVVMLDDSGSMNLTDDGAHRSRLAIGEAALAQSQIIEKLREKLTVRIFKTNQKVPVARDSAAQELGDATDLAAGLTSVLEQVPPDSLAGVIMVSDGQHNRPSRVDDVARRFGVMDAPIAIVAVGSSEPPRDAAILAVRAPAAIHLGDRMRVAVDVKFDGLNGETARVRLRRADQLLEEQEFQITQDRYRQEVKFAHVPEAGGVGDYQIEIDAMEGERFQENNLWEFETVITAARTNVLIVENYPRWEFRYLRNLFYGRDKSVHLQYVLLRPDQIEGQARPAVSASASRPFGEAEATRLPANEDEWRKFDVIMLGDIDPRVIPDDTWEIISRCINERGAMLVIQAGPRFMPHAVDTVVGRELVPVETDYTRQPLFTPASESFRIGITTGSQDHPILQQTRDEVPNERIWSEFPTFNWRHPITRLKPGAEVLLAAVAADKESGVTDAAGLSGALGDLATRRERESNTALLVTRQTGKGKVALLLTDQTWRLRQGAGDYHHHRFWGNLVRWGAGPLLRAGGERVRLGTDQLSYTSNENATFTARLRDGRLNPVTDDSLRAELFHGSELIATLPMRAIPSSNGFYEASFNRFPKLGKYQVRLRGDRANSLVAEDGGQELVTELRVVGSRGPLELADTTLNLPLLENLANLSGGKVVMPEKAEELAALFQTAKNSREEIRETALWGQPWVLVLITLLLTSEWLIRRATGLP